MSLRATIADMKKGPAGPLHDAGVDAGRCYEVGVSIDRILRARRRAQVNDTPPGTNIEYSSPPTPKRGSGAASKRASAAPCGGDSAAGRGGYSGLSRGARAGVVAGTLLAALLLVVAEFTTLFTVHVETSSVAIKTVTTGSHHAYALIPIAVLAAALAIGVFRDESRPALLAIGLLGIVALLIALVGDLPDANATGLAGSSATHFVSASSTPSTGMYLETLGAAVLVITCGVGFMAIGAPALRPASSRTAAPPQR
jgi:hypothetical protein